MKVTDFGIARSGASQMTEAGSIVGTAQYLSPEQARGDAGRPALRSLLARDRALRDAHRQGAVHRRRAGRDRDEAPLGDPRRRRRRCGPEVSHDLDAVVMRALAKDPDQRYASAEEMDADLARVARGASVSHETEEAMTQVARRGRRRSAMTAIVPRGAATPPPAPPAYRPPSLLRGGRRAAARRGRCILGLVAIAIARRRRLPDLQQASNAAIDTNTTVAVDERRADAGDRTPSRSCTSEGFTTDASTQPERDGRRRSS